VVLARSRHGRVDLYRAVTPDAASIAGLAPLGPVRRRNHPAARRAGFPRAQSPSGAVGSFARSFPDHRMSRRSTQGCRMLVSSAASWKASGDRNPIHILAGEGPCSDPPVGAEENEKIRPHARTDVRIELDVDAGSVTILECRPPWNPERMGARSGPTLPSLGFGTPAHVAKSDARTGRALPGPVRPDARLIMLPTRVENGVLMLHRPHEGSVQTMRLSRARLLSEVGRCPTRLSTRRARSP
jgi:hypothetical protein